MTSVTLDEDSLSPPRTRRSLPFFPGARISETRVIRVKETLNFADVPADAPYFNSGVMLIDLPRWKAARVSERALAILDEHSDRCINVDQDALNIVGVGNWSVLPPRWNFQVAGSQSWSAPHKAPS